MNFDPQDWYFSFQIQKYDNKSSLLRQKCWDQNQGLRLQLELLWYLNKTKIKTGNIFVNLIKQGDKSAIKNKEVSRIFPSKKHKNTLSKHLVAGFGDKNCIMWTIKLLFTQMIELKQSTYSNSIYLV